MTTALSESIPDFQGFYGLRQQERAARFRRIMALSEGITDDYLDVLISLMEMHSNDVERWLITMRLWHDINSMSRENFMLMMEEVRQRAGELTNGAGVPQMRISNR